MVFDFRAGILRWKVLGCYASVNLAAVMYKIRKVQVWCWRDVSAYALRWLWVPSRVLTNVGLLELSG